MAAFRAVPFGFGTEQYGRPEMTAAPRLSIGLPVYNGENYLAAAIESLLGQTYGDFELIISDNASTDGTEDICRGYAAQDPRIRYCRQPQNIGGAPNHNYSGRSRARRVVQVGGARRPLRAGPAATLRRCAGQVPARGAGALLDRHRRRFRRRHQRHSVYAGYRLPERRGAVPQHAVRYRRRRRRRGDPDERAQQRPPCLAATITRTGRWWRNWPCTARSTRCPTGCISGATIPSGPSGPL